MISDIMCTKKLEIIINRLYANAQKILASQDRLLASPRTSAFCESIPPWEFEVRD